MSVNFKLKPIALAMMPILFAGSTTLAFAAEESKKADDDDTEVIEISGYRGSVIKAINDKKFSQNIVDSIFAEDIGKTTDQNVADALSRVTGVSIQETDGEGTKISVRGAGANLNNISLNGVTLTSSDPNQGVDLSSFSADVLSQISVYKTSSADHDEGSLGANVILRSAKPLSLKEDRLSFEIQGKYNQFADEYDSKITGAFSKKFFDEKLGIIVTAVNETNAVRRDAVSGNWLDPFQELPEPIPAGKARDLDGNLLTEDTHAIMQKSLGHDLHQNQRDRFNLATGIQFQPFETTDIQLNLNYSKQTVTNDNHKISLSVPQFWNNSDQDNLTVGKWGSVLDPTKNPDADDAAIIDPDTGMEIPFPAVDDPQEDWWVVNTDSRTVVKSLNRFGNGSIGRSQSEQETVNKVATLTLEQEITEDFRLELKAGYSRTEYDTIYDYNVNTASWNTTPNTVIRNIPLDELEPVGFDCTSGPCQMVVGNGLYTYALGGINNNQRNFATTSFNPLDPMAHHVGYTSINDGFTSDTNKSIFLDFDWDVDTLGLTKVEFGGKWSQREKDVYRFNGQFNGPDTTAFDPNTGRPVPGQSASSILTSEILEDGAWPVDDWMSGLASKDSKYSTDFLNGWGLINADKAFYQMFALDDIELEYNDSGRRQTIQDNFSYYGKLNFEYFDGRLTGDVGTRFVHTEVESPIGNSVINFFRTDRIFTPHEMRDNGLWDNTLDACTAFQNSIQTVRIDGTHKLGLHPETGDPLTFTARNGTVYTGTAEGTTIPNEYPCYEPAIAEGTYVDPVSGGSVTGPVGPETPVTNGRSWWTNIRHADNSTIGDKYQRLYKSTGFGESDIWLPSLNLNYQMSEEWIGRFAVSKTMARPGFDQLRPGFTINENVWGQFSTITAPNPQLQPLKSENLDLSLEWYFNQSGQLSLAYFKKDMTDFVETVKDFFYYKDMRHEYDVEQLSIGEALIPVNEDYMAGEPITLADGSTTYCQPERAVQDKLKGTLNFGCRLGQANIDRNGAGATTSGIEFAYRQTYDFLPGALSGLGLNFNYTLADSETDAEVLEQSGKLLKALPQAYTPKHTANTALYWEKYGHSMKLTHRYTSIQLARRGLTGGAEWKDARSVLDFSATYKVNDKISLAFNALNLTNSETRNFFTSTSMWLGDYEQDTDGNYLDVNGDVISVTNTVDTLSDGSLVTETMPATKEQIDSSSFLTDMLVQKPFDEGNPMDDSDVPTHRTISAYKTGRQYRLSLRVKF